MNVALAAPLLNASMPTLPTPAKRSRKRASSTRIDRISKRAVLTRSIIGRVPDVLGPLSLRPLASPVTTRMRFLPINERQYRLYLFQEVILLCPGNQRFYLVNLQFLYTWYPPRVLYQVLQLLLADLRIKHILQCRQARRTGR